MGMRYSFLINRINDDFKKSGEDNLVSFIRKNEEAYMEEFKLGEGYFAHNICILLEEKGYSSKYYLEKLKEYDEEAMSTEGLPPSEKKDKNK